MVSAKLICNPVAGRGRANRLLPDICRTLNKQGVEIDLVMTQAPQEATALAQQASAEGYPLVVAVGGDGTIQEVASGLVGAAGNGVAGRLGIIPVGTGNDFLKMLAIPNDWKAACAHLLQGQTRRIDVGRVNGRIFINTVGIGFDAQIGVEAQKIRRLRGQAVYLAALARNLLFSYATPCVRVQLDGETLTQTITLMTIGNGRCAGGGFWLTPSARIDDGCLDVCLIGGLNKWQMLALVPKVMQGRHVDHAAVRMAQARTIVITSDEPLPVHADGEILASSAHRLQIELLPAKLDVIG